ncbi:MAG: hypothetical protein N4A53_00825 [Pelagimonas sp.]|nr:hypothetical protein [Pelagimonas sp.]
MKRAAQNAGYTAEVVSTSDDVGVIQKRIVQNLYQCPVVVCDISGRNANVMFELGMRLAFDKPTVVIKDDKTPFSFDTSPLETLTYPRDLRYTAIEDFLDRLSKKIADTANSNGHDSFLKSFGSFRVAKIDIENASTDSIILEEINSLKTEISNFSRHIKNSTAASETISRTERTLVNQVPPSIRQITTGITAADLIAPAKRRSDEI